MKYCVTENCRVLLTKENSKVLLYVTKEGISKTSIVSKCIDCLNSQARKTLKEKTLKEKTLKNKKSIVKRAVIKKDKNKKLTTREKMRVIFDEQARREKETKEKGKDAKMLNPVYVMVEDE